MRKYGIFILLLLTCALWSGEAKTPPKREFRLTSAGIGERTLLYTAPRFDALTLQTVVKVGIPPESREWSSAVTLAVAGSTALFYRLPMPGSEMMPTQLLPAADPCSSRALIKVPVSSTLLVPPKAGLALWMPGIFSQLIDIEFASQPTGDNANLRWEIALVFRETPLIVNRSIYFLNAPVRREVIAQLEMREVPEK